MSSSSASAVDSETKKYDVFLNFRGTDTRQTFISHLYKALEDKKINTYIDYRLNKGGQIAPALLNAIEESKISVVVFSKHYATSSWCLDELVHILKCKERNDAAYVIPIFYKIDPTDIRSQKNSYELEERFKDRTEIERRLKWKDALTKASNLSGFHSTSNTIRDDSDLIEQVIKDILKKLNRSSGLERFIRGVRSFLIHTEGKTEEDLLRSALSPLSVQLSPPYNKLNEVLIAIVVVLHDFPRQVVCLNQYVGSSRTALFMLLGLLATIPDNFYYIGPLAGLILVIYIYKNVYLYKHRPNSLHGARLQSAWVFDSCVCLSCFVYIVFGRWLNATKYYDYKQNIIRKRSR